MATRKYIVFIKVGTQAHMEKLLQEGVVFCKPLDYFTQEEEESLRYDKYEGAGYISQLKNIEVLTEDGKSLLGTGKTGQLYYYQSQGLGNVYCLYGIETKVLKLKDKKIKTFNLDMSGLNFGEYAVVIFKPAEFIQRMKREIEAQGLTFKYAPVNYYDENNHQGNLSPFYKSLKFASQNEIRFWIPNTLNKDLVFRIGSISDIAALLPISDLAKLGYGPA